MWLWTWKRQLIIRQDRTEDKIIRTRRQNKKRFVLIVTPTEVSKSSKSDSETESQWNQVHFHHGQVHFRIFKIVSSESLSKWDWPWPRNILNSEMTLNNLRSQTSSFQYCNYLKCYSALSDLWSEKYDHDIDLKWPQIFQL